MMTQNTLLKGMFLSKTSDTPEVNLCAQDGLLEIAGRSLPENAEAFYQPVIDWVKAYTKAAPQKTTVKIELEYFNSSSVMQVLSMLFNLEELYRSGKEVTVIWSYNEDDELMEMKGRELESIIELPFNLIAYSL